MQIRSTLSKIAMLPKPPLSLLRLGAASTPVGAVAVGASIVGIAAFTHRDQIKSTLGNIADNAKKLGTVAKDTLTSGKKTEPAMSPDNGASMLPLILVGTGAVIVIAYIVLRK